MCQKVLWVLILEIKVFNFILLIQKSKTILWNGPMGVFEMSNFENGTKKIGEAICKATEDGRIFFNWRWRFCCGN